MSETPYICRRCWWSEGGKCFNEDLAPIRKDPDTGLRVGNDLTKKHLASCKRAGPRLFTEEERRIYIGEDLTRFSLLMRNAARIDKPHT